jgi:hypothetical protein
MSETSPYNYEVFLGEEDFLAFRSALPVGSAAPDFPLVDEATGETVRLSDYWKGADLVIEFGSLT